MCTQDKLENMCLHFSLLQLRNNWNNPHCEGKQVNLSFNDLGTEICGMACALKQMLIYVFLFYLSLLPSNFKSYYVKNPA